MVQAKNKKKPNQNQNQPNLETELEILGCVIFLLFIAEETLYLTSSTQHRKQQLGEFGTYASTPGHSIAVPGKTGNVRQL